METLWDFLSFTLCIFCFLTGIKVLISSMLDTDKHRTAAIIVFIMSITHSCISLLLILCGGLSPVLGCDWLRYYGDLSNSSLTLLRLMGGQLTTEECPVPFPKGLYRHIHNAEVESQLVFIRDSLKLMSRLWLRLYHHDNPPTLDWDADKFEHFLMAIRRQMDGIDPCVSTHKPADRKLSKYFRRLERSTLKTKGDSTASWELIRRETKLHLDQLDLLVSSIRGRSSTNQQHR